MTVLRADLVPGVAAADLSSYQYHFVYASAVGDSALDAPKVSLATDTQNTGGVTLYILYNAPTAGQAAALLPLGGNAKLKVGGTLAFGAEVMTGATGKGVALAGSTKYALARLLEAGVDGDIVEVETIKPSPMGS